MVEALVCSHCHNVVGVRNAGSDPNYICKVCVASFDPQWMDPYLRIYERQMKRLEDPLGMMVAFQEIAVISRHTGDTGTMVEFAIQAMIAASAATVQELITPGDAVRFRDETAALLGMIPQEMLQAGEVCYAN